jgi:cation diffusion facilitator CzcD-associated flavoprotein CzcO
MTDRPRSSATPLPGERYDVVVVGGGLGGIYAVHRFAQAQLTVLGLEGAPELGGVWHHNRYPGARVDLDSVDYCYHFSDELANRWRWSERYASQAELLQYLNLAADVTGVRPRFRLSTRMTAAQWHPEPACWQIDTSAGDRIAARYLVMTTGNLSATRAPAFPGLERFGGRWVLTGRWPQEPVDVAGQRVAVIGTGSSGVQVIPELAEAAEHLTVFQRTANYAVPAWNRPVERSLQDYLAGRRAEEREMLLASSVGTRVPLGRQPASAFSPQERTWLLERQWQHGGQGMTAVFSDESTDPESNQIASEFVRGKIRETVSDPGLAERLCPRYPIGTRRLALHTGRYYETFNRDNVSLVHLPEDPIVEVTRTGIRTRTQVHEVDLIVFALGFEAFTGALDGAGIRNADGQHPTDRWQRGPRTMLGMMTAGFPNLFLPTGPGSPSVLANMILGNEFAVDWIADAIVDLEGRGMRSIETTQEAETRWTQHVSDAASRLLRLREDNYMVHVNADGSRRFVPYVGGLGRWVAHALAVADEGYGGFSRR